MCDQHRCLCGTVVDCRGTHELSCSKSSARIARHSYINDIIYRAFVRGKIASVKEPVGLSCTDGKRPDGLTLIPWHLSWQESSMERHSCRYNSKFLLDVNFSNCLQCCRAFHLAQRREICRYSHYAQFLTIGFRDPRSHLFKALAFLEN